MYTVYDTLTCHACGMKMDARYHVHFRGRQYDFCSLDCKEQFEEHPMEFQLAAVE